MNFVKKRTQFSGIVNNNNQQRPTNNRQKEEVWVLRGVRIKVYKTNE